MTKMSTNIPLSNVRLRMRLYGPVWAIVYSILLSRICVDESGEYHNLFPLVLSVMIQSGLYISTKWSENCCLWFNMRRVDCLSKASHVYISTSGVCLFQLYRDCSRTYIEKDYIKMYLNTESGLFEKEHLPVGERLFHYIESVGLSASSSPVAGDNSMDIPISSFFDLFKEHVLEPFFVFQLFCVLLWLLDEYWNYALMTLIMLILLESQLVNRRIRDLNELRKNIDIPIIQIYVYRQKKWIKTNSKNIYPNDIIAFDESNVPCDLVLLENSALVNESMLTGESVPILKQPLQAEDDDTQLLDMEGVHRGSVLFAGSSLLRVVVESPRRKFANNRPSPPSAKMLVGFVVRTGFETSQGELIVTILNAANRINASSREAYFFIALLVCVALCAVVWVIANSTQFDWKLFLAISRILTSVVPPEFPITMSLTVTLSLAYLVRNNVYCTEPFRIPLAGKVTNCCFDKTGTLTSNDVEFHAVHLQGTQQINEEITRLMGTCHSLISCGANVLGDPIEVAIWKSPVCKATFSGNGILILNKLNLSLKKFNFDANLQRMSVFVSSPQNGGQIDFFLKGSPESVAKCCLGVPDGYIDWCNQLADQGLRVLAMAHKRVSRVEQVRAEAETGCNFLGLITFTCVIKPGTVATISALVDAGIAVSMITGDHLKTAVHVAERVGIIKKDTVPTCVVGDPTEVLESGNGHTVAVWARQSPGDKKIIVSALNKNGRICLFCGDGTNDVAALKEASIGIGLMSGQVSKTKRVDEDLMGMVSGHASIAAPFVYRGDKIRCVLLVLCSGRATLSLVIQMYKLLAINSLITAFSLSFLTMREIKFGDTQTLLESLLMSILSFLMSKFPPCKTLSGTGAKQIDSVFYPQVIVSITLQSIWHIGLIYSAISMAIDETSQTFIQLFAAHLTSTVVNFEGPPSLPNFFTNKPAVYVLAVSLVINLLLASELVTELNEMFELVPGSPQLQTALVLAHLMGGWTIANLVIYFANKSR